MNILNSEKSNVMDTFDTTTMSGTRTAKNTDKVRKLFKCTQEELYFICFMAWKYCGQQLEAFNAFDADYTKEYVNAAIGAVTDAGAMKNLQQRNLVTSWKYNESVDAAEVVLGNFQNLKRYICKAYTGKYREDSLVSAGKDLYSKASEKNWNAVSTLITNASAFITDHRDTLMAKGRMPADFAEKFIQDGIICKDLMATYKNLGAAKDQQTMTKQEANNAIYKALTFMLADAQVIFKDSKQKKRYIFSNLYKYAKSQSPASLKGYVLENGKPVVSALVQIQNTDMKAVTDKDGYYSIGRVLADTYVVEIHKNGYTPVVEDIIFKAGTAKRLNITLQPAQMHTIGLPVEDSKAG